jgi:hypothetical protein
MGTVLYGSTWGIVISAPFRLAALADCGGVLPPSFRFVFFGLPIYAPRYRAKATRLYSTPTLGRGVRIDITGIAACIEGVAAPQWCILRRPAFAAYDLAFAEVAI